MLFTVTYREKTGAKAEVEIEASSRAACVAECKRRGIAPVGIREGRASSRPRAAETAAPHVGRAKHSGGTLWRAAILAATCLAAGIGAWWFFGRNDAPPAQPPAEKPKAAKQQPKPQPKPEARPAPVETNAPPAPVPVKIDPNARPEKVGEELNGYIKLPSGRLHKVKGVITNDVAQATRGKYAIFPHHCENEIACYLSLKPGDAIFGTMKYNGRFKEEFIRSLETPIVIEPDDTDETKELKRNVREAKIQLKAAMDRGEDIEQIMAETRRELQDLARYKMNMTRMLHELRREKPMSVDELQDAVDAANRMLEAKGIAPMKFGPLVRQKMLIELGKEPR